VAPTPLTTHYSPLTQGRASTRRGFMKAILALLSVVALISTAAPAAAQMKGGKKHNQDSAAPKKPADDKGYKAALDRLPNKKYDPWGNVR
jgi:hypothetical protein